MSHATDFIGVSEGISKVVGERKREVITVECLSAADIQFGCAFRCVIVVVKGPCHVGRKNIFLRSRIGKCGCWK